MVHSRAGGRRLRRSIIHRFLNRTWRSWFRWLHRGDSRRLPKSSAHSRFGACSRSETTASWACPTGSERRRSEFTRAQSRRGATPISRSSARAIDGSTRWWGRAVSPPADTIAVSERIDRVLTHPVAGILVFGTVMFGIFEALFAGAEPFMGAIEGLTALLQRQAAALLPAGILQDLITEGVIAGVGNVIVFAPQILMLFLFIGFLEDSGYLARVAFVIDRPMKAVGLHGKAFVPLLSGFRLRGASGDGHPHDRAAPRSTGHDARAPIDVL